MTLGSHQRTIGKSQTHLTPRWILDALGPFDLDPCAAPEPRPWNCAYLNWSCGGLDQGWIGRVWLNPPFDRYVVGKWVQRLADHGNGIALLHARTETDWFQPIWRTADAILFLSKRVHFCLPDGTEQRANSGAPVVLAAWGENNKRALLNAGFDGWLVTNRQRTAA